jgi:hypothetical protein
MKFNYALIIMLIVFNACKTAEKKTGYTNNNTTEKTTTIPKPIELAQEQYGGFETPEQIVINNNEKFSEYWEKAYKNLFEKPEKPKVDFETERVILIAAGEKNNGGYSIYLSDENPTVNGDKILYHIILEKPGKNCIVTEAITSPFRFYVVKNTSAPIEFKLTEIVKDCK